MPYTSLLVNNVTMNSVNYLYNEYNNIVIMCKLQTGLETNV